MSLIDEYDGWRDEAEDRAPLRLEDTGTCFDHYAYLQSLWGEAFRSLRRSTNPNNASPMAKTALRDLEGAVKLIEKQMEVMANYGTKKFDLARQIESIPEADKIKGGRGTGDPPKLKGFFS